MVFSSTRRFPAVSYDALQLLPDGLQSSIESSIVRQARIEQTKAIYINCAGDSGHYHHRHSRLHDYRGMVIFGFIFYGSDYAEHSRFFGGASVIRRGPIFHDIPDPGRHRDDVIRGHRDCAIPAGRQSGKYPGEAPHENGNSETERAYHFMRLRKGGERSSACF